MALNEFKLIAKYFEQRQEALVSNAAAPTLLTIGDDTAVVKVDSSHDLLITTDTLVEGSHFYPEIHPYDLGYKSVAVNISDISCKGAIPTWISLALTLPRINETWLEAFSAGLFDALNVFNCRLIGGDTVKGKELSLTLTAHGITPNNQAFLRHQAEVGDKIFVTNHLGGGYVGFLLLQALHQKYFSNNNALSCIPEDENFTRAPATVMRNACQRFPKITPTAYDWSFLLKDKAYDLACLAPLGIQGKAEETLAFFTKLIDSFLLSNLHPQPWVKFSQQFKGFAKASMDLSDGLYGDLCHILERSKVNAKLYLEQLPTPPYLDLFLQLVNPQACKGLLTTELCALHGGEDYQMLFTVAPEKVTAFKQHLTTIGLETLVTEIGEITAANEQQLQAAQDNTAHFTMGSSFTPHIQLFKDGKEVNLASYVQQQVLALTNDPEQSQEALKAFAWDHFAD